MFILNSKLTVTNPIFLPFTNLSMSISAFSLQERIQNKYFIIMFRGNCKLIELNHFINYFIYGTRSGMEFENR